MLAGYIIANLPFHQPFQFSWIKTIYYRFQKLLSWQMLALSQHQPKDICAVKTHTLSNSTLQPSIWNLRMTIVQFRFLVFSLPFHFWINSRKIFKIVRFNHHDLTHGFLFINQLCLTTVEKCGKFLLKCCI